MGYESSGIGTFTWRNHNTKEHGQEKIVKRAILNRFPDYFVDVRKTHDKDLIDLDGRSKEHA